MNKKILLIVLVVLLLLGGGAYAYFATDAFKTEKEIFFSYMGKETELQKSEGSQKVLEYLEKQENTPYSNKGEIFLNVDGEGEGYDVLNKSKISFEGKVDNSQKLVDEEISVDLSAGVNVPIKFKREAETYGIQTNLLSEKFIAVRNENLKALAEKFGITDTEVIPDKIDINEMKFTEEETKQLNDKYLQLLKDNLEDDLFSKEKADSKTVITLSMTEEKFIDVASKLLEAIRDDEILLNKLSVGVSGETYKEQIDKAISELKSLAIGSNKVEIKMYIASKTVEKYEVLFYEQDSVSAKFEVIVEEDGIVINGYDVDTLMMEVSLKVEETGNDVAYIMSMKTFDESNVEFTLKMEYKNVLVLDNVEEVINISMSADNTTSDTDDYVSEIESELPTNLSLNYTNTKTFEPNLTVDKFDSANTIVLNDATDEELQTLIMTIYQNLGAE